MKTTAISIMVILAAMLSCNSHVESIRTGGDYMYDSIEVYHWEEAPWGIMWFMGLNTESQLRHHKSFFEKFTISDKDSLNFISSRIETAQMDSIFSINDDSNKPIIALLHKGSHTDTLSVDELPFYLNKFNNLVFKDGLLSQYFIEAVAARNQAWAYGIKDYYYDGTYHETSLSGWQ